MPPPTHPALPRDEVDADGAVEAIARLDDICWCCGDHICNLDDGRTWAEGPLRIPRPGHLRVRHAVHALCTHMHYSIPDLLRMTTYAFNYRINTHVDPLPLEK